MTNNIPPPPPGFEMVGSPGANAMENASVGAGAVPPPPEGFSVVDTAAPKKSESVVPFAIDQAKKGLAGTLAIPNLAVDVAQSALDTAMAPGKMIGNAAKALRQKLTGEPATTPEDAKAQWFVGNAPDKENFGGYKQASKAWEAILRADKALAGKPEQMTQDVEPPKDNFGGVSKSNQYIGKISNFLGGALIPGAGPIVQGQRKLLTALVELGSNTASGIGAVEGKNYGGKLGPMFGLTKEQGEQAGEALFSLTGPGLVGAAGQTIAKTSQAVVSGAEKANIVAPWDKAAQKAQAETLLHKEILQAVDRDPQSLQNLSELADLQKKMADFKPGVGQATNNPELVAMTKQVSQQSGEAMQKAVDMDAKNQAAIAAYKNKAFPEPNPSQPINTGARAKFATDSAVIRQDIDNTDRQLNALSEKFDRSVDKTAVGDELRSIYWGKRAEVKGGLDRQINNVYKTADDMGVKADMTDVRDMVKRIAASEGETFQQLPGTWKKIMTEFGGPEQVAAAPVQSRGSATGIRRQGIQPPVEAAGGTTETSFEKLHSLYREANREWADAIVSQKPDVARKLSMVKDALEAKVNQFQGPQYGMLGEKFGQFNQDYTKYAQTFKEGAGGKLSARTKQGFGTDAEDIVDKVFLKGTNDKAKGLDDFFSLYGNDERAGELLRDGIVDNFSRAAVKPDGTFNSAGAQRWMKNNDRALEQLPNLRAELQGTTDVSGALINRRKELVAQRQILDKSVLASAARDQRPELLVEAGMKDPRMFKALLASAKTDESKQSLARSIVDMAVGKNDPMQFLRDNETVLKPVLNTLGKGHWSNLQTIAKAEEVASRVTAPTKVELGKVQDIGQQTIGTSVPSLLAKVQNVQAGRTNDIYQGVDILSRYVYKTRTEEMARLRQAALFDPEAATMLAKIVQRPGGATPQDLLDLKAIGFANGISIGSQALQTKRRHDEMSPEEKKAKNAEVLEGVGKWK